MTQRQMSFMRTNQIQSRQSGRLHAHHRPAAHPHPKSAWRFVVALMVGVATKRAAWKRLLCRKRVAARLHDGSDTAAGLQRSKRKRREIHSSRLISVI